MKKAKAAVKAAPKKLNKNNKSTTPAQKVGGKVMGKLKSIVKAMSAKPIKKGQTKAPAKPAAKVAAKPVAKVLDTKSKKTPPVKPAPAAKVAPVKAAAPVKGVKTAPVKPAAAAPAVAAKKGAVEAKPVKGAAPAAKEVPAAKGTAVVAAVLKKKGDKKLTAAQLHAEHLERMCRETACENYSTTKGYCRLHYIQNWKKIKRKEMILKEGKLNQYVEELVSKYPDKYIEVIRQDLSTEVNFNKVIHDLELDESIDDLDYDGDSIDSLIGSIRKDGEGFDDDEF